MPTSEMTNRASSSQPALTRRQADVFEFIRDKIQNRGYGPTVREIGEQFRISSPNGVMCHLKALEKKGLIIRAPNMSRAIQLVDRQASGMASGSTTSERRRREGACQPRRGGGSIQQGEPLTPQQIGHDDWPTADLPLAGRVAAGVLQEAVEQHESINLGTLFTKRNQFQFVLEVRGDSMIDAQIADGDYVIVRQQSVAQSGQMVVAQTEDGEATLKYWFPEKGRIRLQPANASMQPIIVADARVLGVVVGVVRKMD